MVAGLSGETSYFNLRTGGEECYPGAGAASLSEQDREKSMRCLQGAMAVALAAGWLLGADLRILAQEPEDSAPAQAQPVSAAAADAGQAVPPAGEAGLPATPAPKIYTVPAGTKVLLQLRSAVNTKSAKPGDGVYLASTFPVVVGTRVMIPAGVYVQGVVDRVERAGRVRGRAQLEMHFTSMIFPNGTVVEIPGLVNSLPGARKQTVKDDGEGTIQQDA